MQQWGENARRERGSPPCCTVRSTATCVSVPLGQPQCAPCIITEPRPRWKRTTSRQGGGGGGVCVGRDGQAGVNYSSEETAGGAAVEQLSSSAWCQAPACPPHQPLMYPTLLLLPAGGACGARRRAVDLRAAVVCSGCRQERGHQGGWVQRRWHVGQGGASQAACLRRHNSGDELHACRHLPLRSQTTTAAPRRLRSVTPAPTPSLPISTRPAAGGCGCCCAATWPMQAESGCMLPHVGIHPYL